MAYLNNTELTSPSSSPITSLRSCPICGGRVCDILHEQHFILPEGHPLAAGYRVVACANCDFVYADTQVSQAEYDAFYARFSKYEDNKTSTGGGGSVVETLKLRDMAASIAQIIPDRNARLVDIGCANGGLLKELWLLGYRRLCGIDPSLACVAAAKSLCPTEAYVGLLSSLPPGLGQFDGVILSHVLEHVQDLHSAMLGIGTLTAPGGVAYIEVPDASRYAECLLAPFQDFSTEHINHFSPQCLCNLLSLHGWTETISGTQIRLAAPGMPYPCAFGFFVKASSRTASTGLIKDSLLRGSIAQYISLSKALMHDLNGRIAVVLKTHEQIIVWGTGQLAMKLLGETCLGSAHISAFVDGNPINQGKSLRGQPIIAPHQLRDFSHPIVVTSIVQGQAIAHSIAELKLPNPVILLTN